MNDKISAAMDGELPEAEVSAVLDAVLHDADAQTSWLCYHLVREVMQTQRAEVLDVRAAVAAQLRQEPVWLCPPPVKPVIATPSHHRFVALSAAASIAAVCMVGWAAWRNHQATPALSTNVLVATELTASSKADPTVQAYLNAHQHYADQMEGWSDGLHVADFHTQPVPKEPAR